MAKDPRLEFSWTSEKILPADRDFVKDFAARVLDRDFAGVHALLASWLQPLLSAEKLRDLLDAESKSLSAHFIEEADLGEDAPESLYPDACYIYLESRKLEDFRYTLDPEEEGPIERPAAAAMTPESLFLIHREWDDDTRLLIPAEVSEANYLNEAAIEFRPSEEMNATYGFDYFFMMRLIMVKEQEQIRVGSLIVEDVD